MPKSLPPPRKRPAVMLAALLMAATLVGASSCAAEPRDHSFDERPTVLTAFTVLADIASEVAGDHLQIASVTKVGAEIHGYEPTPRDIAKAAQADLILDNGLGLEAWFEKFLHAVDVPHVVVSEGITPIDITGDAYAGKPNPHTWMSPVNVQIYVDNMVEAFSRLAPEHADAFTENGAEYKAALQTVHDELVERLAEVPERRRVLVTCEGAFSYLARDSGLREAYIWPVNAEQQATPQQIAAVIALVSADDVPAVFCESTVSDKPMQQVVEATGVRFGGVLYVDSLSESDGAVPTYLDLIRHDTAVIVDALTAGLE